ncbi:TetR/AcrR family transcriptional regulator [Celeribacter naphthalenivorans]|uniref:TetR/AcrR family transcriptional regulator n=1 Tax=Celeribacter naphthalenivorans TaxID=1614694 RepID=UPI001CFAA912|nr:TetR/AcrR family transcriptional regulator [Celeribacter naphthalenivorans]
MKTPTNALSVKKVGAKARATKERLIEGALRVLLAEGSGASTRNIAKEADLPHGTLHYHFETKEALLCAVLDRLGSGMALRLRTGTAGSKSLDECITRAVETDWDIVKESFGDQVVQYELTFYALRRPDASWIAQDQYRTYIKAHADVFLLLFPDADEAVREKIQRLAKFVMATMDGMILQELVLPGEPDPADLIDAAKLFARHLGLIEA